jgi:hypothetical protein
MTRRIALCLALLLVGACAQGAAGTPPAAPAAPATPVATSADPAFQKGMTFTSWWRGEYAKPGADQALAELQATGANWVGIIVTGYQDTVASTAIRQDRDRTPSDQDLIHAIRTAKSLGLRVMLKPHVDLSNDGAHWRGDIGSAFTSEAQWQAWFAAYRAFIDHYATLAKENGVDQFSVGTELASTSHRAADWRAVVAGVRQRFSGPLTYASNHSGEETRITWWDAVDYIGVDAYYPLADHDKASVDELAAAWTKRGYLDTLAGLAERYRRPVLLTEIGYRSVDGATIEPWLSRGHTAVDLQEQANAYQAALDVFWGKSWLVGIYWWNWDSDPSKGGTANTDFTPRGKPAEDTLKTFYHR